LLQDNWISVRKKNTVDLQQQCKEKKESIQKLEEVIRELEAKIDTLMETNETPEFIENRKSSQELRRQLLREIQMYTPTTSYDQEETQS